MPDKYARKYHGLMMDTIMKFNKASYATNGSHAWKPHGQGYWISTTDREVVLSTEQCALRCAILAGKFARHYEGDKRLHRKWASATSHKWTLLARPKPEDELPCRPMSQHKQSGRGLHRAETPKVAPYTKIVN